MQNQTLQTEARLLYKPATILSSTRSRSEDVLIAIATLGLVATIVDGDADYRELELFTREFRKRFALSRRQSLKLITAALGRIKCSRDANVIDGACDTLNEHLDSSQKTRLFDVIAEVLVADGKVHQGEEYFLDYIARKLDLVGSLERTYASI